MRFRGYYFIVTIIAILVVAGGCRKEQRVLTAGGIVKFSDDTLKFDTVFTAAGSYTTGVLIYNPQSDAVILSNVRMANGSSSYFHLNVDGRQGNDVSNIRIAGHDSIYVFATVNIDPNDTLTPFLVTDYLVATMNNKEFSIPFTAYGQNAHYVVNDSLSGYHKWLTDKPYVVINKLAVGPGATLNIPAGCRVYMHQNARMFVYGTLRVDSSGVPGQDSVVFQGDRLDRAYFGYLAYPGEWGGFYFVGGSAGFITNAVIKNCGGSTPYYNYGIQPAAIEVDDSALLVIDHSRIQNCIGYGILSIGGLVTASNCLVHSTGAEALAIIKGGYDSITNCTFANYGNHALNHNSEPTVAILNYFRVSQTEIYYGNLDAVLQNCIVYGSLDSEMICDTSVNAGAKLRVKNCLLNMGEVREPFITFTETLFNQDPMFKEQGNGDFHIKTGSPAIGKGSTLFAPPGTKDLDGKPWSGMPDIGCYMYAP